jgi:hypothetical protein
MSKLLELSLSGQYREAAELWFTAVKDFHATPAPEGTTPYPAHSPFRNVPPAVERGFVSSQYINIFNTATQLHRKITQMTQDRHLSLHYHAHHYNIEDGRLINPSFVQGPIEREAPAFLYNPVSPTDERFEEMVRSAMDFDVATSRLGALVDATGWYHQVIAELNFVRSVENMANRLVEEASGKPKEIPPYGQLDSKYWGRYIDEVAFPLMTP